LASQAKVGLCSVCDGNAALLAANFLLSQRVDALKKRTQAHKGPIT